MAVGVFNAKLTLTGAAQSLDTLLGGTQTFNYMAIRRVSGAALIGNAALTVPNGYSLNQDQSLEIPVAGITGASVFLIGPGVVEFFGNSTA